MPLFVFCQRGLLMVRARVFDVRGVITVEYEMLKNERELGLKHQQTLATAGAAMTD